MKKISLAAAVLGLTTVGALALGQTTFAAEGDTNKTKTTQAIVEVEGGGELLIDRADEILFKTVKSQKAEQTVDEQTGKEAMVIVDDYRGMTNEGWTLKAKLTKESFADMKGMNMFFKPSIMKNEAVATAMDTVGPLNKSEQLVTSIDDSKIADSLVDTEILLNAELVVPGKTKASQYSTDIIWNLSEGPEA
ncbi:WxL domain-containing protein [Enterococcus sp. AZ109]|uniref:WxL domain-containing protein n=1 Tax=Enterococcus sp. AZ109 TaxID=2774634 RepID=UPI003F25F05C